MSAIHEELLFALALTKSATALSLAKRLGLR